MLSIIKRKIIYLILFIVFAVIIDYVSFKIIGFGSFPKYFGMNLAFMLYVGCIIMIIPMPEIQFWIQSVMLLFQIIIAVVNINLSSITGELFFWDMIALLQDGVQALEGTNILNLSSLWVFGGIFIVLQVIHAIIYKYRLKAPKLSKTDKIHTTVTTFVVALAVYLGGFLLNHIIYVDLTTEIKGSSEEEILLSEAFLYETMFQPESTIRTFGSYPFYMKGLSYYLGIDTSTDASDEIIDAYLADGLYLTNDFTGVSQGNNVIMVLLESFEYFAIDENLTPNLYQLFYVDGIPLSNYHAKIKTDVSEASSIFGGYPSTGSLYRNYTNNDYPISLPNMLRNNTEISDITSFHNNVGTFYNRNIAHPHFGFDEHVDSTEMELRDTSFWINSDEDMLRDQVEAMVPEEGNFMTLITTFIMHGGYEKRVFFEDVYAEFDDSNFLMQNTNHDRYLRTYLAAAMDLDRAVGILFDRLEETNQLDNTTLIFYADHTAYYYGFSALMREINPNDIYYTDQYRLPAVIYDNKLKQAMAEKQMTSIDKFASVNDFTPTVLNLLGIEYNPLWYVGSDLFSNQETVIISRLSGIFNDKFYTTDGKTVLYRDPLATNEDYLAFQSAVAETMKRQKHLNLIYRINYYKSMD